MNEGESVLSRMGQSRQRAIAAYRRRDRKALAALIASKLLAYRSTTIYGRTARSLRSLVQDEVIPRLLEQSDARVVTVDEWPKGGPTVAALHAALHEQLELGPADGVDAPRRALLDTLERAMRRSERPILLILHGVDRVEEDRDPIEERRFVDALAQLVSAGERGLALLMVVEEANLGIFRELLRGRWRLLVHDVRVPEGEGLGLVPLPLIGGGSTIATAAAGAGAGAGAGAAAAVATTGAAGSRLVPTILASVLGLLGLGVGAQGLIRASAAEAELARCKAQLAEAPAECPEPTCPACVIDPPDVAESPGDTTTADDPTTGTTTSGPTILAPTGPVPSDMSTSIASTDGDATTVDETAPPHAAKTLDLCDARAADGACAKCVRGQCCEQLTACKSRKWQRCVLTGAVPEGECTPEAIEKGCRALALCALEYQCHDACL